MQYLVQIQEKIPERLRLELLKNRPVIEFTKFFAQSSNGFDNALSFVEERVKEISQNSEFEIEAAILVVNNQ